MQDLQNTCKILQVLQEKYLQDLHISCKTVFTGYVYVMQKNFPEMQLSTNLTHHKELYSAEDASIY